MSILPIISVSDLQRHTKASLDGIKDYAVIQSHGTDRAFLLHPALGRILMESGMLDALLQKGKISGETENTLSPEQQQQKAKELETMIGSVLRELSKR